jgi:hypothetical protein
LTSAEAIGWVVLNLRSAVVPLSREGR